MSAHRATVLTSREGAWVECSCGWLSPPRRVVRGWIAGARQVERQTAQADWANHVLEETTCPS